MITLFAAMSRGRVIGKDGGLPWGRTMKTDQQRYKNMTRGKTVVIGSGTYDPKDEYLHHTNHIFLMTSKKFAATDQIEPISNLTPVLEAAQNDEVFVLGGAGVFEQFLPHADKLELTYIEADIEGDRYFPDFDENDWKIENEESFPADEDNKYAFRFVTLIRK